MIIFFTGFDILFILIILFTLLAGAVDALTNMLNILFVVFVIKNFVQDIVIGFFKNRNSLLSTLCHLITDTLRIGLYFCVLGEYASAYSNSGGGLSFFGALFNFLLFFILGGILYLMGEIISMTHSLKTEDLDHPKSFYVFGDILSLVLLALLCWWALS